MLRFLACLLFVAASASAAPGQLLWQFDAGGAVAGNALVHQGSVYVTGGQKLHVLNTQGELQWVYDAGSPTRSSGGPRMRIT